MPVPPGLDPYAQAAMQSEIAGGPSAQTGAGALSQPGLMPPITVTPGPRPGGPGMPPNAPPLPPVPPGPGVTPQAPGGAGTPPADPLAPPAGGPAGKQPGNEGLINRVLDLISGEGKKKQQADFQKMLMQASQIGAQAAATGRPPGAPENRPLDFNSQIRQLLAMSQQQRPDRSPFVVPGSNTRQYPGYAQQAAASPTGALRMMRGGYPNLIGLEENPRLPIRESFGHGGQRQSYVNSTGDTGRSDKVEARLSPNEYVIDAESVAMLGDGSPDAGAKKLDQMRNNLRRHKGKSLAKGKFSPDAKAPESYLS